MNTNCVSESLKDLTARHGAMLKAIPVTQSPTCNTSQVATSVLLLLRQIGHTPKHLVIVMPYSHCCLCSPIQLE